MSPPTLVETEVPLASVSYLGSMWTSSEAVYDFYNPTSSTHVWEVYEWGATTGTNPGWGITYDYTS